MMFDIDHTFVTSDHHFGSSSLLGPCKVFTREQEDRLIDKWNEVVSPNDAVIYNGDFCDGILADAMKYRQRLNGHIFLVKGNHDRFPNDVYKALFDDVFDKIILDKWNVIVHHVPDESLTCKQIYGHMHRGEIVGPLDKTHNFCSCIQAHDGYPVLLRNAINSFTQQTSLASCLP